MDIFKRHDNLVKEGVVVEVSMVNQVNNGLKDRVESGGIPLITFTGYVLDIEGNVLDAVSSSNTFEEAFISGVEYGERLLKKG